MIDFLKRLPYKTVLPLYVIFFLVLTIIGKTLSFGWLGFKFSIPLIFISVLIDLLLVYKLKYKK